VAPHASTCPIDFSRERSQDLAVAYDQVGVICFGSHDETDEQGFPIEGSRPDVDRVLAYQPGARHRAVQREACSLGGELVAPVGICGRSPGHLELGVWRKKQSAPTASGG